ncbi:YadA family autotransporter adhesin, partial [Psychrobacter pacificensis]|uniref:YadA family autotransporter adhesin n=1 Tax=Psychrobacter pacificensis TaxID=112002 RepID=UPI003D09412E
SITNTGLDNGGNTITNVGPGVDGKDAVNVDQLNATNNNVSKGFNIAADNGAEDNVQLGETVTYTSTDGNIVTTVRDNEIDFGLGKDLTVGDDNEPGTIVVKGDNGKDGVSINGADGTIGLNGKDGASGTISVKNGVPGVNGQDGITRIVIDDIEVATMEDGLKFAGNTGDTINKKLNETLTVKGELAETEDASGANLRVDSDGNNLNLVMAKNLKDIDSITVNNGGPVINQDGINMNSKKITNLAPGVDGTDAVNVEQLNTQVAAATTEVKAGTNVADIAKETGDKGQTIYTVNAKGTTATAGSDAVTVEGTTDNTTNITDYKVDLSQGAKDSLVKADTALQEVVTQIDGIAVKTIKQGDNTANFVTGTNIKLEDDGQGGIKLSTADNVTFKDVTAQNINAHNMTVNNVGNSPNAVTNKQYVDEGRTQVTSNNGTVTIVKSNTGNGSSYDLSVDSQGVTNNSQIPVVYTDAQGNKVYKQADGTFNTAINGSGKTVSTGDIITSINSADGSTTTPTKLTNIANGTISANSTDAINGSQLYDTNTQVKGNTDAINKGFNISADNGTDDNVQLGDTVNYTSDDKNIVTTVRDNEIEFSLADKVTIGDQTAGNAVTIDGQTGTIGGLTNTTFDPNDFVSGQAATEDQLAQVATQAGQANKGWKLSANGDKANATDVKPTNVVDFSAADKNIVVSKDNNDIKVGLADNIKVDSVTAGNTTVNNEGITIKAPVSDEPASDVTLTASGLNNGGNTITNVAPGVNGTDAVNLNQLKDLGYKINTKIDKVGDEANAGISSAMAMAALPQAYIPGKSMVTGGMATYNGQGAVAVGVSKLSDNGRWVLKISGSADTEGNAGGAVGAGFHF